MTCAEISIEWEKSQRRARDVRLVSLGAVWWTSQTSQTLCPRSKIVDAIMVRVLSLFLLMGCRELLVNQTDRACRKNISLSPHGCAAVGAPKERKLISKTLGSSMTSSCLKVVPDIDVGDAQQWKAPARPHQCLRIDSPYPLRYATLQRRFDDVLSSGMPNQ